MSRVKMLRVRKDGRSEFLLDEVLDDCIFELHFNDEKMEVVNLFCNDEEEIELFILGFMIGRNLKLLEERIELVGDRLMVYSENYEPIDLKGFSRLDSKTRYPYRSLFTAMDDLLCDKIHNMTGAIHMAGLYGKDGKRLVKFADVGRHNALDKVIGWMIKNKVSPEDKMILSSGRISESMVLKVGYMGVELLVSKSSVMMTALRVARKKNLTVVGFLRGGRMNIYTSQSRLVKSMGGMRDEESARDPEIHNR